MAVEAVVWSELVLWTSQKPQGIGNEYQHVAFVENDGSADTDQAGQGGDDEQGSHPDLFLLALSSPAQL